MGIGSIASRGWNYAQRLGRLYPDFVFGTGQEAVANSVSRAVKNRGSGNYFRAVWNGTKDGVRALETTVKSSPKNFWQRTWHAIKTTPSKIAAGWRYGGKIADKAGKTGLSKFWSQFKGSMKGLGKRMPLIGTLLIAATELPNIFSAFKEKGFFGGLAETGKSLLRLGSGTVGAMLGQALIPIPIVGPIVGYIAGDWLMSKFTGKSHTEKKMEAEAQQQALLEQQQLQQQQMMQTNPFGNPYGQMAQGGMQIPQPTMTPQQLMAMQQMLYNSGTNAMDQDFMAMTSGMGRMNYMA